MLEMVRLIHWNARSLVSNGHEFKKCIDDWGKLADVICIQESWLRTGKDFLLDGYSITRCDRQLGTGGGCVTFFRKNVPYKILEMGSGDLEYISSKIWMGGREYVIINIYNPCKPLQLDSLLSINGMNDKRVILCGDFNACSPLWGGRTVDHNGRVLEALLDRTRLVCLNDGSYTRVDGRTGVSSALDLTFVSGGIASLGKWEVGRDTSIGSDHFPVFCQIGLDLNRDQEVGPGRWIFRKANWDLFSDLSETKLLGLGVALSVDEEATRFADALYDSARSTIPRSKGGRKGRAVPWWTEECSLTVRERNKALKRLKRDPSIDNLIMFRMARGKARRTIRNAKRSSWERFCSTLGRSTPIGQVWSRIKYMSGHRKNSGVPVLTVAGQEAVSEYDRAKVIAESLVNIHSSDNLNDNEKRGRENTEKLYSQYLSRSEEFGSVLDCEFTVAELRRVINRTGQTSPGKDEICYVMLRNLSDYSLNRLLKLYNKIWLEGQLPKAWKEAVIVPVGKPGKDLTCPGNYRPIALTSHLGKVMEKMIVNRLTYYVESKRLLSSFQSGFRHSRGTMDPVVCLDSEIRRAQVCKEVVLAVFFDVEKAYDMVWKNGLLIRLRTLGIAGRMFNWIRDFLFDRSVQVKIGSTLSGKFSVENGTPQGSVISPLIFSIMIDDIFKSVPLDIGRSLFADDGALWKRGRNESALTRKMQEAITAVEQWGLAWGFRFSIDKTKVVLFSNRRTNRNYPLYLYGREIERVDHFRFLGVWFDSKLTWKVHVKKVVEACKPVLNVMRCLCGSKWGASRASLMTVYISLIRSRIDYGCIAYGWAKKTIVRPLIEIQKQALRLCCGALRSSPVLAIQVELNEKPLSLRFRQLALHYWTYLQGHTEDNHPTVKVLNPTWESGAPRRTKCFAWDTGQLAVNCGLSLLGYSIANPYSPTPFWMYPDAQIDFYFLEKKKLNNNIWTYMGMVEERLEVIYPQFVPVYTDGSKDPITGRTGLAVSLPYRRWSKAIRTSDHLSVYSVEMMAIATALQQVESMRISKSVICTDSCSVLESLRTWETPRKDLLLEIFETLYRLSILDSNFQTVFMWVPAHKGVRGNEEVDQLAKKALLMEQVYPIPLGQSEAKSYISSAICKEWQALWDNSHSGRHLYKIQREVNRSRYSVMDNRRKEVVWTRLRLGHTRLHSTLHKIGRHPTGLCDYCQEQETVEHVILYCRRVAITMARETLRREIGSVSVESLLSSPTKKFFKFLEAGRLLARI